MYSSHFPSISTMSLLSDVNSASPSGANGQIMESDSDSTMLWDRRFAELATWKTSHGNCNVPKAEGRLGRWVVRQRELHKKGRLEEERKRQLDNLGFVWNTNEAAWEHRFALLLEYSRVNGHCCVPISERNLGMWVAKMRANRRRGKLPEHRIKKLDSIGFIWNTAEADWMDKFEKLLLFREREGHACVPFNEGELGWWVNTQRQSKRKGKLSKERERLLNEASFIWNPQEFLAARRRLSTKTKSKVASPGQTKIASTSPSNDRKRNINVGSSLDFTPPTVLPKRHKLSASPTNAKRVLLYGTESHGPLATGFLDHMEQSPQLDRRSVGTPGSQVTHPDSSPETYQGSPLHSESMSPFPRRNDVQSISSLLTPTAWSPSSPHPMTAKFTQLNQPVQKRSTSELPSFHNGSGILTCLNSRGTRSGSPQFVLPPISSLKLFSNSSNSS